MADRFVTICYIKDKNLKVVFSSSEQAAEVVLRRTHQDHTVLAGCVCRVLSEWEPTLTKKEN